MAREGLRVLVVSKKSLTEEQYQDFEASVLSWDQTTVIWGWAEGLGLITKVKKTVLLKCTELHQQTYTLSLFSKATIACKPQKYQQCVRHSISRYKCRVIYYADMVSISKCQSVLLGNETNLWTPLPLHPIYPTLPRTHPGPTHCLNRAGLSPLQSSAPGPLLKCIIVWAELVGSSESPTESHTEFVFLYESYSDCFCFISLANCPGAGVLKIGVNQLIMSVLYFQLSTT